MVDVYAPGIELGAAVPAAFRQQHHLSVAPYVGYSDSTYVTVDGLRDLTLHVDEYVDEGNPRVSPSARVEEVGLETPDAASTARLQSRLTRALGRPTAVCYSGGIFGRFQRLFWPGERGRGIMLVVSRDTGQLTDSVVARRRQLGIASRPAGSATVVFGTETPSDTLVQVEPCGRPIAPAV